MSDARERTRTTYVYELWRASSAGILETAGTTFLLTIALRYFEAGSLAKAIIAGAGNLGLLLSPLVVYLVSSIGWKTGQAAARILACGAGCFLVAALIPTLPVYVVCNLLAMTTSAAIIPLLTQMYQDNYPAAERGRRFSRTVMVRIATAAFFSHIAGSVLDGDIRRYRWLLLVFALALGLASFCLGRCPTRPIPHEGGNHPFRGLRFVREDAVFRRTLICWMLMGFANLMMLPLRVEYLANPKYHFSNGGASVAMIAFLTGVVPNLARLVMSPIWGYLFDRANFFTLRVVLNLGFALGILTFFMTDSFAGLVAGAIIYGISGAGGDVAWSLWVTKLAPPGRVADYMSVHTFFTGVRGVLAPMLAFFLVARCPLGVLAGGSAVLILLATAILIPEIKHGRRTRPAAALVEEISE